jgi:dolichol-phosphate mannosyltransferase
MIFSVLVPVFDERVKIQRVVDRLQAEGVEHVLIVDDGSRDGSAKGLEQRGVRVLRHSHTRGVGRALATGLADLRARGFDVAVIMAGNDKDDPREIPRLLAPIAGDEADFVQGSRWMKGGSVGGDMPGYRHSATKLHPMVFSVMVGKRLTESTNGFRAFRLSLLDDPRIDIDQPWLDRYELEPYLLFKAIRLGYRHLEVPCTKIYPPKAEGVTKMRPVLDWWSILRPVLLLGLGLRR